VGGGCLGRALTDCSKSRHESPANVYCRRSHLFGILPEEFGVDSDCRGPWDTNCCRKSPTSSSLCDTPQCASFRSSQSRVGRCESITYSRWHSTDGSRISNTADIPAAPAVSRPGGRGKNGEDRGPALGNSGYSRRRGDSPMHSTGSGIYGAQAPSPYWACPAKLDCGCRPSTESITRSDDRSKRVRSPVKPRCPI